ncbi:TonB family protein [Pyxidicoccus trucidator]|uniref:TonB family protein n=1 Tax=Pyxidicoccus trucidator TaxID=2709662 RepID=UPI0013DB12BD|nr:TonB family protein [Pyxidicoccus trucidator]
MKPPEPPLQRAAGTESIAELILGPERPKRSKGLVWALLATASLHGAAGALAWQAWRNAASRAPPPAAPRPTVRIDHVVSLPPPAAPEPPPLPPPAKPPPPVRAEPPRARVKPASTAAKEAPPPRSAEPAQAGEVVAAKEAQSPLDFTGFDIASGQAPRYAGGVTASTGRSTTAVAPGAGVGEEGDGTGESHARPVQLPARNWSCPWPKEAEALRLDEQTVVLRVVVTPEGRVTTAELMSDPGHGFGEAALACARSARFEAAVDRAGRRYLATSPPIRVRFKRR